jgi:hypothetical protein
MRAQFSDTHVIYTPLSPATSVFQDKRQLIIKRLTLSFSHPVSVSRSRGDARFISAVVSVTCIACVCVCVFSLP